LAAFDTVRTLAVKPSRRTQLAISKDLLDILVCPECKTPVTLTANGCGLKCATCKRVYPIRDEIPVMLLEEAMVAAE